MDIYLNNPADYKSLLLDPELKIWANIGICTLVAYL